MLSLRGASRTASLQLARRAYAVAAPKPDAPIEAEGVDGSEPESSTAPLRRRLEAVVRERDAAIAAASSSSSSAAATPLPEAAKPQPLYPGAAPPNPLALPPSSTANIAFPREGAKRERLKPPPPRLGPRARALLRAKEIAKALSRTHPPAAPSTPSTPGAGEDGGEPTLEDLLAKRPAKPPNTSYTNYPTVYNRIHASIDNAFVIGQMVKLAREMGLRVGATKGKHKIVERVMESWGWPHPSTVPAAEELPDKKEKGGMATLAERDIDLPAADLFLFLRDTEQMKYLVENRRVVFAFPTTEANTATTRVGGDVEGERRVVRVKSTLPIFNLVLRQLGQLREHVRTTFLPVEDVNGFKASRELLASISNISEAYIELSTDNSYRMSARRELPLSIAKRLLNTAALQLESRPSQTPVVAITPTNPPPNSINDLVEYHLPPFFPAHSNPLPWFLQPTYSGRPLFRMRNVTKWATKVGGKEILHWEEKLDGAEVRVLQTAATAASTPVDRTKRSFGEMLQGVGGNIPLDAEGGERQLEKRVSIQFGHILIPSKGTGIDATFASPIKLSFTADEMPKRMSEINTPTIFAPSLTPALIANRPFSETKRLRRLRYRLLPTSSSERVALLTCTYTYPVLPAPPTKVPEVEEGGAGLRTAESVESNWRDDLGKMLDRAVAQAKEKQDEEMAKEMQSAEAAEYAEWERKSAIEDKEADEDGSEEVQEAQDTSSGMTIEDDGEAPADEQSSQEDQSPSTTERTQPMVSFVTELSWNRQTDLLMPDRPVDARLTSASILPIDSAAVQSKVGGVFKHLQHRSQHSSELIPVLRPPSALELELGGKERKFVLEMDEEVEVQESEISIGRPSEENVNAPTDPAETVTTSAADNLQGTANAVTAPPTTAKLVLRSVKVTDCNVRDRGMSYSELEASGSTIPEEFWREFAYVSRDVPPGAAALRRGAF